MDKEAMDSNLIPLMKFYNVSTLVELVKAQEAHIVRLQQSRPPVQEVLASSPVRSA